MIKEYVNGSGYRIKASEKAYNLLYKKNGFRPVSDVPVSDAGTTDTPAAKSGKNADTKNLPKKAAAKKSGKAPGNQNAAGQPEDEKESPGTEKADCDIRDEAGTPEGE